jgi:hypothetical protein
MKNEQRAQFILHSSSFILNPSPFTPHRSPQLPLFRSPTPTPATPLRFRPSEDLFAFRKEGEVFVAQVSASSERSVELFLALVDQMPLVVDLGLDCVRSRRSYVGEGLGLSEVKEAVARLKAPLVASAGVELTVYTDSEQLSLSPMLDLWVFARSDRWLYLLQGEGLEERAELPARTWSVAREAFTGAPDLVAAVTATAERLTLRLV